MKGILIKTNQGWVVRFDRRTLQDPSAEDGELPLLPDDLWVIDHTGYALGVKQEIEFEEITEDIVNPINKHLIKFTYSKLIHHPVDTNKMIDHIGDVNEMVEDNVEKLAKEYANNSSTSNYEDGINVGKYQGFIEGYNKAKETLYTEEQVRKAIDRARNYNDGWVETENEIIQSLKQPKQ